MKLHGRVIKSSFSHFRNLKQERDRLLQLQAAPSCLAGLPTQVGLDALSNSREQSNDGMEDDSQSGEESRKRPHDDEDEDMESSAKRREVMQDEESEGVGGIRKLVEFCSKDIK